MTEKRYFKREWEEEYYIFDSETISEKEFDEKVEYEDYQAFVDSMQGDEVVDLLNALHEENQIFREALKELKEIGDYQSDRIKELNEENQAVEDVLIDLKKIDSYWDGALLQGYINEIANILGVDLE